MGAVMDTTLPEAPEWATRAKNGDGYGDCYGYGYGDGYGDGDGYGYGYGYGYGDGDGYGYGDGYGDGYGYGYGYGDGDASKAYWASTIGWFASKWPEPQRERLRELQDAGAKIGFWRSDAGGAPANGGGPMTATPGLVQEEPGPLRAECGRGQLHATLFPPKWRGERWWIVALIGEVRESDDKMWALKREIIGECI